MRCGAYPGSFNPPTTAHLAVAEAARRQYGLDRVDLIVSRVALGKEGVAHPRFADRLSVLGAMVASRPWLGLAVVESQLLADVAQGYDIVVMGADKWGQVIDPAWYGGSESARDEAVARLPRVVVVPRPPYPLPAPGSTGVEVLDLPTYHGDVSSTAARGGSREWMAPEAAAFDERTGAWTDLDRYRAWVGGGGATAGGLAR